LGTKHIWGGSYLHYYAHRKMTAVFVFVRLFLGRGQKQSWGQLP